MTVFGRALHAEWIKWWSVRSTWVTLAAALVCAVGLGVTDTVSTTRAWAGMPDADKAVFDPVGSAFAGLTFAQLAFGMLGVLIVTAEFSTGSIIPTLVAMPRRGVAYLAKAAVLAATTLTVGEALSFGQFAIGQAILKRQALDVGLGEPGVLRAVAGAGLYLCVVAMVGFGLGALLRNPASATAALIGLVFLAYGAARAVEGWSYVPSRLLLSNAGDVIGQVHAVAAKPRLPSLRMAYLDLMMYLVVAVGAGGWRSSRDTQ